MGRLTQARFCCPESDESASSDCFQITRLSAIRLTWILYRSSYSDITHISESVHGIDLHVNGFHVMAFLALHVQVPGAKYVMLNMFMYQCTSPNHML